MKITIDIDQERINFLDITMELGTGLFKPYRKPGDRPLYVSAHSNHPPHTLKNIPTGVERRLSDNSANRELFDQEIPIYQAELDRVGHKHKLEYNPRIQPIEPRKKKRSKRKTYFNPPYSMNVATNVGQEFLKLIDEHFPPGHILRSVMNRTTIKVSYRCLPNMGAQVAKHNSKILKKSSQNVTARTPPSCNCQRNKIQDCPLPGACNQEGVIYQATVKSDNLSEETYIGLAQNFKKRFYKHKASLENYTEENSTTLSTYYWNEIEAGAAPSISWKILEKNVPTFNPVSGKCQLCIREKFNIILKPQLCSLNRRQEIFAHCRHKRAKLIERPPT